MSIDAMKLALEALEYLDVTAEHYVDDRIPYAAITALRQAIEQAQQEPVAWMVPSWLDPDTRGWQSESFEANPVKGWVPLFTYPPQRQWVGLTDEDCEEVERWVEFKEEGSGRIPTGKLIRYIEAKLKEKNT